MGIDPSGSTDAQIDNLIANHEAKGVANLPLCLAARLERDRRRGFKVDATLALVRDAARHRRFVSYKQVAEASGVPWSKAYFSLGGHLWDVVSWAHVNGAPMLSAIIVNRENLDTGAMKPATLTGFTKAARDLGYAVIDEADFLREQQEEVFRWAASGD